MAIPMMLEYHAVIGLGDGLITTGIISYLPYTSFEILKMPTITFRTPVEAAIE